MYKAVATRNIESGIHEWIWRNDILLFDIGDTESKLLNKSLFKLLDMLFAVLPFLSSTGNIVFEFSNEVNEDTGSTLL